MKNKIITSLVCTCLGLGISAVAQATPHNSWYNPSTTVQKCKGKTEGTPITYAANGVIWNGTCQTQFVPSKPSQLKGDEPELNSICSNDSAAKSVTIAGQTYKGKCAVAFAPPRPSMGS